MDVSEDKGTKENEMLTLTVSMCDLETVWNFQFELISKKFDVKIKKCKQKQGLNVSTNCAQCTFLNTVLSIQCV